MEALTFPKTEILGEIVEHECAIWELTFAEKPELEC